MSSFSHLVTDLTQEARQGRCRPAYGCDELFPRVFKYLQMAQPQLVLVVGPEGAGRTRFVEGLALAGTQAAATDPIRTLNILRLDFPALASCVTTLGDPLTELTAFLSASPSVSLLLDDAGGLLGLRPSPGHIEAAGKVLREAVLGPYIRCIAVLDETEFAELGAPPDGAHVIRLKALNRERRIDMAASFAQDLSIKHGVAIHGGALHAVATLPQHFGTVPATPDLLKATLDRACVRFNRKSAMAKTNPELIQGTSLKALGDLVGAYDVLRTVEEDAGKDIQGAAVAMKNNLSAQVKTLLQGQRDFRHQMIELMVAFRFGFTSPFTLGGLVVVWGSDGSLQRHAAEAIREAVKKTAAPLTVADLRTLAEAGAVDEILKGAAGKAPLNLVLLEHAEGASKGTLAALAQRVMQRPRDGRKNPLYNLFIMLGYETSGNDSKMKVLDHLKTGYAPGFPQRCQAVVELGPEN